MNRIRRTSLGAATLAGCAVAMILTASPALAATAPPATGTALADTGHDRPPPPGDYRRAYQQGYQQGYHDGGDGCHDRSRARRPRNDRERGYVAGYNAGFDDGLNNCKNA